MICSRQAAFRDHHAIATLLLARGASTESAKRDGNTPLHLCAQRGLGQMAALLVARGADAEARNLAGISVREMATQLGHAAVLAALDTAGAEAGGAAGNNATN